ncbi:class I adenylate cyclase, partial [Kaarinaea lacus]
MRQTPKIDTDSGPDFRAIKGRFMQQNRQRKLRAMADLKLPEKEFLELLPLLFHVNHPILPGYIDKDTPAGVPEFTPEASSLAIAKRQFKSFAYRKKAYRRFHVFSLFMMGSTGTIAYSDKSDFDIWIVYDSSLDMDNVERLRQKVYAIEQWARDKGVQASLFLVDPERFRQGENSLISQESSGSAQHYLLLEEFYRTSILLAGRYPLWWLVPPEEENNYEQYAEDITRKRLVHVREHVDLGGLNKISADEFYGATLWLLYKSIDSP